MAGGIGAMKRKTGTKYILLAPMLSAKGIYNANHSSHYNYISAVNQESIKGDPSHEQTGYINNQF